jgi:hypothetical protein
VIFKEGQRWIENQVFLEVPAQAKGSGELVSIPMYIQKQWNLNFRGELCIWMHYSDHLGKASHERHSSSTFHSHRCTTPFTQKVLCFC